MIGRRFIVQTTIMSTTVMCLRFTPMQRASLMRYWGRATFSTKGGNMTPVKWPAKKVRTTFVDFFQSKYGHTYVPSSPVVPIDDPTLLFTNAGMNQFKSVFLGQVDPNGPFGNLKRAVNTQKCIRAGGKHNDLDDVGKDVYHHTYFEMMGTWSFGDYFKKDTIEWAWELLTVVYKIPKENLYASYFGGDDALGLAADIETRDMWLQFLPADRVLPFGKDNFWEMGDSGPCGPCSEIHFDRIGGRDAASLVNQDDPDVVELWNLVFMQYNRETDGSLSPLPKQHVDTGMGFERLVSVLQGKPSNYDTDVFSPILNAIETQLDIAPYGGRIGDCDLDLKDTAYRILADHVRTLCFAISDGALPSNEGRGYVLRRILRRAVRFSTQMLGAGPSFLPSLVPVVIETYRDAYPELVAQQTLIVSTLEEEEALFQSMLVRGERHLKAVIKSKQAEGRKENVISGKEAFFLHDSLGFSLDLTEIMALEYGYTVDRAGFETCMREQKENSRGMANKTENWRFELSPDQLAHLSSSIPPTDDQGKYTPGSSHEGKVEALFIKERGQVESVNVGDEVGIITDATPFYAVSGGQVADKGIMWFKDTAVEVSDVVKCGGFVLHHGKVVSGVCLRVGDTVQCEVDPERRHKVAQAHTSTHLLGHAIRKVLKNQEVVQKGSMVDEAKLRLDFSYNAALTSKQLSEIEASVEESIGAGLPVYASVVPWKAARDINGIQAVFGEVYPVNSRVVSVQTSADEMLLDPSKSSWREQSVEFCGGTHLSNTSEAVAFCVLEEGAVAKGIRRISALTGQEALEAKKLGSQLQARVDNLRANDEAEMKALSLYLSEVGDKLGAVVCSAARSKLAACQKSLAKQRKSEFAVMYAAKVAELELTLTSGEPFYVIDVEMDSQAAKLAMDVCTKSKQTVLLFCVGAESVICYAHVPSTSDLRADEWVKAAVESAGGKSGGSASVARGTFARESLALAQEAANRWPSS